MGNPEKFRSTVDRLIKELKKDNHFEQCAEEFSNIDLEIGKIHYAEELVHNYERRLKLHCGVKLKIEKDEQKSLNHRKEGIALTKQRKYEEALKEFNKSICFAAKGSGSAAIGYSNRSAVLFEMNLYHECLENIRLARESEELPSSLLKKLQDREAESIVLNQIFPQEEGGAKGPVLTLREHQQVKGIVCCLELTYEENRNWVYTSVPLKIGDVIAIEKPFAVLVHDNETYSRCHNCLKPALYTSIPCPDCTNALFCDSACLQAACEKFHKYECPIADYLLEACGHVERFALRMVFEVLHSFKSTEKIIAFCQDPKNFEENYFTVNWESFNKEEHYKTIYNKVPKDFYGCFQVALLVVIVRDYLILKYTPLKDVLVSPEEKDIFCNLLFRSVSTFVRDPAYLRACDQKKLGASISGFGCLLRPGRFPNVRAYWQDGYIVYKAIRDIHRYSRLLKDHPDPAKDNDDYSTYYWSLDLLEFFTECMFMNVLSVTVDDDGAGGNN